jgi:hypothetical protein
MKLRLQEIKAEAITARLHKRLQNHIRKSQWRQPRRATRIKCALTGRMGTACACWQCACLLEAPQPPEHRLLCVRRTASIVH